MAFSSIHETTAFEIQIRDMCTPPPPTHIVIRPLLLVGSALKLCGLLDPFRALDSRLGGSLISEYQW